MQRRFSTIPLVLALVAAALGWAGAGLLEQAAAQPPGKTPMGPPGGTPMGPGMMGGYPGMGGAAKEEPEKPPPPLPDDIKAWRRDEFNRARAEGHAKFAAAVELLGKQFAGKGVRSDRAAKLLANLLKSEAPAGGASGMTGGYPGMTGPPGGMTMGPGMMGGYPGMGGASSGASGGTKPLDAAAIRAIVEAFGVNGSAVAHKSVQEILAGTLTNDNDVVACESALEVLLKYLDTEYETLLMTILISPTTVRAGPSGTSGGSPGGTASPYPGSTTPGMTGGYPGMTGGYPGMTGGYPGMMGGAQGKLTAADLQTRAIALIEKFGNAALRQKLAQQAANPAIPADARAGVLRALLVPSARNLASQLTLYRAPALDATARQTLQQQFTMFSSMGMSRLLGLPKPVAPPPAAAGAKPAVPGMPGAPGGMTGPPPGMTGPMPGGMTGGYPGMYGGYPGGTTAATVGGLSPEGWKALFGATSDIELFQAAGLLWSSDMCAAMAGDLRSVESIDAKLWSRLLASTVPADQVRTSLRTALYQKFSDGPRALEQAGMGSQFFSEPGFLVVVKSLPRRDPYATSAAAKRAVEKPRTGRTDRGKQPGGPGKPGASGQPYGTGPGGPPGGPQGTPQVDLTQPDYAWFGASARLSRYLCQQFYTVSNKNAEAAPEDVVAARPVALPPKASFQAEYRAQWPEVANGKAPRDASVQSPMTVHFLRFEIEAGPKQAIAGLKRKMGRAAEHSTDSGYWFESLVDDSDGRKKSMDVWIMRSSDVAKAATTPAAGAGGYPGMAGGAPGGPGGMPMGPGGMPMGTGGPGGAPGGYGGYGGMTGAGNRLQATDIEPTRLLVDVLLVSVNNPGIDAAKGQPKSSDESE